MSSFPYSLVGLSSHKCPKKLESIYEKKIVKERFEDKRSTLKGNYRVAPRLALREGKKNRKSDQGPFYWFLASCIFEASSCCPSCLKDARGQN